jgi:hypothetical protein
VRVSDGLGLVSSGEEVKEYKAGDRLSHMGVVCPPLGFVVSAEPLSICVLVWDQDGDDSMETWAYAPEAGEPDWLLVSVEPVEL